MIPTLASSPNRSHSPSPPPIDMTPVDAHRVHLHLLEHSRLTGEYMLALSDLKRWPNSMSMSTKRFKSALDRLRELRHIDSPKLGKKTYVRLINPPIVGSSF